jgi:hypothetical protein
VEKLDPSQVRSAMQRLSALKPAIFGVEGHQFVLNAPLSEAEVLAFENQHRVPLPADYRDFVRQIGNGGAGPYYGILPLGCMDGASAGLQSWSERDGLLGVLSESFPHRDAWNDLSGMPAEELTHTNQHEYERRLEAFEKSYWASERVNGALPICHMGCALRIWLVVSGEEMGHLWRDGRADDTGLSPLPLKDGSRATFSSWYREWLEEVLRALR